MEVILISGQKNKIFNFALRFWVVLVAGIVVLAIILSFIYNMLSVTVSEVDRTRLRQLTRENEVVRKELKKLENEVVDLSGTIDSLESYDQKLRTYASLQPIDKGIQDIPTSNNRADSGKIDYQNINELSKRLDNLLNRAELQSQSFKELVDHIDEKRYLRDHTPSIAPVQGWFVSGYGYRLDPFTGNIKMHEGIDIAGPIGTPIVAPADGIVKTVMEKPGFGLTIEIVHGYGLVTFYAHCQRANIEAGATVKRGDIIAFLGDTGKSTGPHLHYEIRVSQVPVNPINYIINTVSVAN